MYVKITNKERSWGIVFPADNVAWDPIDKITALEIEAKRFFDQDEPDTGKLIIVGMGENDSCVIDVTEHNIYILGENGQTIDRIS